MAVKGSNILTGEEEGRKEIILSSQSGKGSAETQRVRHGREGSIITDILTVQKATSNPERLLHNSMSTLNTESTSFILT